MIDPVPSDYEDLTRSQPEQPYSKLFFSYRTSLDVICHPHQEYCLRVRLFSSLGFVRFFPVMGMETYCTVTYRYPCRIVNAGRTPCDALTSCLWPTANGDEGAVICLEEVGCRQ